MANRLNSKEMAEAFRIEKDPLKVVTEMNYFINSFSIPTCEFFEELKQLPKSTQKRFTDICLIWIDKMTSLYCKNWFDDRNKYSCRVSCEINNFIRDEINKVLGSKDKNSFEVKFVEKLSETHRTLMQSFSEIVFRWIVELSKENKRFAKKVVKEMPERFYRTPMI